MTQASQAQIISVHIARDRPVSRARLTDEKFAADAQWVECDLSKLKALLEEQG